MTAGPLVHDRRVVDHGAAAIRNGKGDMPPFAQVLSDSEIGQLAAYVAGFADAKH